MYLSIIIIPLNHKPTTMFKIGDICVDRSCANKSRVKRVQIRKFNDSGSKAIVHYVHCPMGMVFAVDVRLLNEVDADGFLRPSPFYDRKVGCKRLRGE